MPQFSLFEYCYRDAVNFKAWGSLLLEGYADISVVEELKSHFEGEVFFIAEQLNIPPLYSELWTFSGGPTPDDHVWHSFETLRPAETHEIERSIFGTVESFVQAVRAVHVWNQKLSPHWSI